MSNNFHQHGKPGHKNVDFWLKWSPGAQPSLDLAQSGTPEQANFEMLNNVEGPPLKILIFGRDGASEPENPRILLKESLGTGKFGILVRMVSRCLNILEFWSKWKA